jgi:hypothetical protein
LRKAPCSVSLIFWPACHCCCVWFLRAHKLSNELLNARATALPCRTHLYRNQSRRVRVNKHSMTKDRPALQAQCRCSGVCRRCQDDCVGVDFVAAGHANLPGWLSLGPIILPRDGLDVHAVSKILSQLFRQAFNGVPIPSLNEPRDGKASVTCKSLCFRFESFAERLSTGDLVLPSRLARYARRAPRTTLPRLCSHSTSAGNALSMPILWKSPKKIVEMNGSTR